jgi:hypothetical protein
MVLLTIDRCLQSQDLWLAGLRLQRHGRGTRTWRTYQFKRQLLMQMNYTRVFPKGDSEKKIHHPSAWRTEPDTGSAP